LYRKPKGLISPLTAVQSSFTELVVTVDIVGVPGVSGSEMKHHRKSLLFGQHSLQSKSEHKISNQ